MYCEYCGKQIADNARFCNYCGHPTGVGKDARAGNAVGSGAYDVAQGTLPPIDPRTSRTPESTNPLLVPVVLLSIGAVLVAAVVGAWRFGLFGTESQSAASHETSTAATVSGEADVSNELDSSEAVGDEDDSRTEDDTDEGDDTSLQTSDGVRVRSGLAEYSWSELGRIAAKIERCSTQGDAISVAKKYNLVSASGSISTGTKDVTTTDGKTWHMRIVGVWHDRADTTSGRAGLTFLSDGVVLRRAMHNAETIKGGWQSSKMRSWLSNDVWATLPSEVSSVIVTARKLTNNTGESRSVSSVTETSDKLWIPSVVELCGPVNWEFPSNPSNNSLYNSIFNAEGTQYALFASASIRDAADNSFLSLGGEWWLRSTSPARGKGRFVSGTGDPSCYGKANERRGVVVGFCL